VNARDWMTWLYLQEQGGVEAARKELPTQPGGPLVFVTSTPLVRDTWLAPAVDAFDKEG